MYNQIYGGLNEIPEDQSEDDNHKIQDEEKEKENVGEPDPKRQRKEVEENASSKTVSDCHDSKRQSLNSSQ